MSRFDARGIADLVAEMVADGFKLTSDCPELKLAIEFSYALYSFGDIGGFPSTAPSSTDEEESSYEKDDEEAISVFPSLPDGFDLSLACTASGSMDLCKAALMPITTYKSEVATETNELQYILYILERCLLEGSR